MSNEPSPAEAAQALADIQLRQQQVIDLAMIPVWYRWAVGALMVVLAAGVDSRAPLAILGFVALIAGGTIGLAFGLRAAGAGHPATLACAAGGLVLGAGGPVLMRRLRAIMLGNRTGASR